MRGLKQLRKRRLKIPFPKYDNDGGKEFVEEIEEGDNSMAKNKTVEVIMEISKRSVHGGCDQPQKVTFHGDSKF